MKNSELERVTVPSILSRKNSDSKISALTAYDFSFASILDQAGIDIILVGDSLGTVMQGLDTTLPVTLDEVVYHTRCVARAVKRALLVGDMPFMSYQSSIERALESAGRLVKEGGAHAVKLEGGVPMAETIARLVAVDIPVMAHIGLTPQSYHRMGGYKMQGKKHGKNTEAGTFERVIEDAIAVEKAGAFSVVLEGLPAELGREITAKLSIPSIGIGAGPDCDGQILVTQDMLGMNNRHVPKFVKKYADLNSDISAAVRSFISEVEGGSFPSREAPAVRLVKSKVS